MGKTEKLVLLSVVLVLVVLFVWSLGGDDAAQAAERDTSSSGEPRYGSQEGGDTDEAASGPEMLQRNGGNMLKRSGGNGLLVSELDPDVEDAAIDRVDDPIGLSPGPGAPAEVGEGSDESGDDVSTAEASATVREVRMMPGWDLVTTVGLEATVDPNMLLFRPEAGATWESVANDLYGKPALADLLRHNNEGMETPGEVISVPAKNDLGPEGTVRYVQVLQGETLWAVSERTLGSGSRWKEIYEANRDVVPDPDFLAPGTVLMIPE